MRVFDPSPQQTFPSGFTHNVSLVDTIGWTALKPAANSPKPKLSLQWLSQDEWSGIKYNSSKLALLDDSLIKDEVKSIEVVDSRSQMVGQGIFRVHQQSRPSRSFRNLLSRAPADPSDDQPLGKTWLPDRSSIEFGQPGNTRMFGQSGTPRTCRTRPGIAKVAGFSSFVQVASDVQRYDLEGKKLYKRLEEGRVAFYGAIQVPPELRDGYRIA
ncbi:hypothetical protein QC761_301436 [Podospora bellae-mahoneyi]|uniref:Uncharacterized protein n=1 Tax=Podospora bellae-mahoneyi TaxID=2093777 RepID=A0ABR0FM29_9PEZI|nr:hypothetical protein QC761_301436 [Podospora bellae-mahoneyi]